MSSKNFLLTHVTERKLETTIRRGRRCTQLLDNFKERKIHWISKEEVLDRSLWKSRFRRVYGTCRKTRQGMDLRKLCDLPNTQIIPLYGTSPVFLAMEMLRVYIEVEKNDILFWQNSVL